MQWQAGINKKTSLKSWPRLFQHNQPTDSLLAAHFSGHKVGSINKDWWDVMNLWPHQKHMRSVPVHRSTGPTENSCYFRWPPLLWNGQNLHVLSVAYRKGPASWPPKALLNHNWVREAVTQQEDKLTVLFNMALRKNLLKGMQIHQLLLMNTSHEMLPQFNKRSCKSNPIEKHRVGAWAWNTNIWSVSGRDVSNETAQ